MVACPQDSSLASEMGVVKQNLGDTLVMSCSTDVWVAVGELRSAMGAHIRGNK